MDSFLIIILLIIGIIAFLGIMYIHLYNKMQESIIRIDEAEARIDNNLRDKFDLLNRTVVLIKSKLELEPEAFKDLIKLKGRKISNFDLDRNLVKLHDEFISVFEANPALRENDEIFKAYRQLELIDDELLTLRNYYNANILNYNEMIKKFPTYIVARIKKYKERLLYDLKDMKDDNYEDFKL